MLKNHKKSIFTPEQIETLFDSLMQDYPIGTFLFWVIEKSRLQDYNFYEFLKDYNEMKNSNNSKKIDLKGSDGVTAVLDGQQRLTSLYIGLKGSYAYRLKYKKKYNENNCPSRHLYLNLLEYAKGESNKYDFRFMTDEEIKNSTDGYWYRVGDILSMTESGEAALYIFEHVAYDEQNNPRYSKEKVMHATNTCAIQSRMP